MRPSLDGSAALTSTFSRERPWPHRGKPHKAPGIVVLAVETSTSPGLAGRDVALAQVGAWVDGLAAGASALLVTGEPGIGKTTIWRAAVDAASARGAVVLVARPVEAELPLAYAALTDLLAGAMEPVISRLPAVQAAAIEAALALRSPSTPGDPLLVARATLSSLHLLAERRHVVVAIDDAQWLDASSARAIGYAARRAGELTSFAIAMRSGHRDPLDTAVAFGERLTNVHLEGLSFGAIAHLVRQRGDPNIPPRRLTRIHEQARGNPFYAIELARSADAGIPTSLSDGLARHLSEAPPSAHGAIEEVAVLGPRPLAAFGHLAGVDGAVRMGILAEDGELIRFSHPLLAAAAYERIPPGRRQALHARAAATTEAPADRARHLALATPGPDEATALLLESVALEERLRGAPEAAAELVEHARRLTPPEDLQALASRTVDHADYLFLSADEAGAEALVDTVLAGPVRGAVRARALAQRALTEPTAAGAVGRLEMAVREPHDDRRLAARTLAQLAWQRGAWLGDVEAAVPEARRALALAEELGDDAALATALTTLGLLLSISSGEGAEASFRRALEIVDRAPTSAGDHTPHLAFAHERWWRGDFATAEALLAADRRRALEHGDESMLMRLAIFAAQFEIRRGRWIDAERLLDEALPEAHGYWRLTALIQRGILRGRRGDRLALDDAAELRDSPDAAGDPVFPAAAAFVTGLVKLADGDAAGAADLLARLPEETARHPSRGAEFGVLIPEAVTAIAAAGGRDRALALTDALERRIAQFGPWGRAALAHSRGVLALAEADLPTARAELAVAIEGYEAIGAPWELANALLAAGMTQRRAGKRLEAGELLDRAIALFAMLGAEPARRAAIEELGRARPRRRPDDQLTAAESRVAALVAAGRTNREVAAQLFTTVATVEAHLTRAYAKLGIRSRTELARKVSDGSLRLGEASAGLT